MRSLIVASAATVVLLTATGPLSAQSPQTNGKDAAKVYAYKKAAPTPAPAASAYYEPMTTAPPSRPDLIPNSVPYGTPTWWDLMGRSANGTGTE
jgi:hypothetical protein